VHIVSASVAFGPRFASLSYVDRDKWEEDLSVSST
jgi:hypothetical protein